MECVEMIFKVGVNVIFIIKGIDDFCLKLFIECGVMVVCWCKKEDFCCIVRVIGVIMFSFFLDLNGDEKFEVFYFGYVEEVLQECILDDECILVKGIKVYFLVFIIFCGFNEFIFDEMECFVYDSLCVVKWMLESGSFVFGGGVVEIVLYIYFEEFVGIVGFCEQFVIGEFVQLLFVIFKILVVNVVKDVLEFVVQLWLRYVLLQCIQEGEVNEDEKLVVCKKVYKNYGFDFMKGKVVDLIKNGVMELSMSKIRQLKSVVEVCISIMCIDIFIKFDLEVLVDDGYDGYDYQRKGREKSQIFLVLFDIWF